MSYLIRKTDTFLRNWKKNPDRYPLIIKGARQVGKTETIRKFAKENYKNLVEINFITEPAYKTIIDEGFSSDHILKLISRIDPSKHFDTGETLLFFDEIQDFPEIATSLKFFKESGKYDVICSGFLFGVQYHRIASISVGYKTDYQMYSMDFEEFLWAKGYQEQVISDMLEHMLSGTSIFCIGTKHFFKSFSGILHFGWHACDCFQLHCKKNIRRFPAITETAFDRLRKRYYKICRRIG